MKKIIYYCLLFFLVASVVPVDYIGLQEADAKVRKLKKKNKAISRANRRTSKKSHARKNKTIKYSNKTKSKTKRNTKSTPATGGSELACLAKAINGEARGEPPQGKVFVGRVILTRKRKSGASICRITGRAKQFAPKGGYISPEVWAAARKALATGANGITNFHSYPKQRDKRASFSVSKRCYPAGKVGGHWAFNCPAQAAEFRDDLIPSLTPEVQMATLPENSSEDSPVIL